MIRHFGVCAGDRAADHRQLRRIPGGSASTLAGLAVISLIAVSTVRDPQGVDPIVHDGETAYPAEPKPVDRMSETISVVLNE